MSANERDRDNDKPVIGITMGELNGIGPEVIIKTFADNRMLQFCTPVIYGNVSVMNYHRKALDVKNFNLNVVNSAREAHPRRVNLVNCWQDNVRLNLGQPSRETGACAFLSLQEAVKEAREGYIEALVTAPIDKSTIQSDEFNFPGHTEYLTQEFNAHDTLMFLTGESFRTGVVTGHIPLSQVPQALSFEKIVDKLRTMNDSLKTDFNVRKPVIAVLGLNPHAGEEGLLGTEEQEIIIPAIEKAKDEGILAMGPYPADGFFGTHMYRSFDGILAMYHDQGLVPFKMMNFESGVNFTAGLPVVRTSPDHGTGYALAGKNKASEQSFREAVYMACEILANRKLYHEVNSDPLTSQVIKEKEL